MIHRSEHDDNYTILSNDILKDSRLSDGAKLLLIFMLSLPDDWDFNIRGLSNCLNLSMSSVNNRVVELEKAGYITIKKNRTKGKFASCSWEIHERPHCNLSDYDLSEYGSSEYGKTALRDIGLRKTEQLQNTNNKLLNKQKTKRTKEIFVAPTVEEVRAYCQERGNNVDAEQFVDFYTSKGWKVGKNPMKDWKACVRTWEKRHTAQKASVNTFGDDFWADMLKKHEEGEA